jgi:hypothetical protein
METKMINYCRLLKHKLRSKKQKVVQKSKSQEMLELKMLLLPKKLMKHKIKFKSPKSPNN